jgi:hypothetical protein
MSAIYANVSNQVAALKELYTGDDYMKDLVYKKNPLLSLIPKDESPSGFAGKYIPVPLVYGTPQGRSATFSNAQGNQTAPQISSFFVYRISNYQLATITNELLEATKDNAGAFVDEAKLVMDTAFRNISNDLALDLFKSGTGSRGQILTISSPSTAVGATVIQLANIQEVVNFEVGMTLVVSATDGGTPSSDTVVLTAVNRSSGVLRGTASANPLSANWAASGYMSVQGDVASGGSTSTSSYLKVSGLGAWLPKVAPAPGDSFWNVDRSADPTRLAGVRYDGASQSIEEALIDGSSLVAREGGQPDMCFMSFASYAALEKSLGAKVQYVDVKHEEADIAFAGIRVHAPYGPITVVPDRSCPANTAYLLQMDTWKLRSLGKAPHILTYGLEGLEGLRVGTADALEIRIGYYANLVCNAPGWNCVITLSA